MNTTDSSGLDFQACQTFDGRAMRVSLGKRTGRATILFTPEWTDAERDVPDSFPWVDDVKYYVNLNPVESATWRKVLNGESIAAIAHDEGISRQAVYARIRGNSQGQGGMIAKNFWVLLWWQLRQGLLTPNSHS